MNPDGSHSALPAAVRTSSERCPMATGGSAPIPVSPGSTARTSDRCPAAASSASVVHRCPPGGSHCRSSAHTVQTSGHGSGKWFPQVAQTQADMQIPPSFGIQKINFTERGWYLP